MRTTCAAVVVTCLLSAVGCEPTRGVPTGPTSPTQTTTTLSEDSACLADVLATEHTHSGASSSGAVVWHDLITQLITIRNTSDHRCTVVGAQLTGELDDDTGNSAQIDVSRVAHRDLVVLPGRAVDLLVGEPQDCAAATAAHGRLRLAADDQGLAPVSLALIVTGCGQPRAIELFRAQGAGVDVTPGRLSPPKEEVADRFIRFALHPDKGGPFDAPVVLGVGGYVVKTIPTTDLTVPAAWNVDITGYAQAEGTASPLDLIRTADRGVAVTRSAVGFCGRDGQPSTTPMPRGGMRLGIVPANPDSCSGWWQVDLYVNDVGQVTGVDMFIGGP